jgi:hypothetical protein
MTYFGEPIPKKPLAAWGYLMLATAVLSVGVAVEAALGRDWSKALMYAGFTLLPLLWYWDHRRQTKRWTIEERVRCGKCPGCGYDLRATTAQCPECGRQAPYAIPKAGEPPIAENSQIRARARRP